MYTKKEFEHYLNDFFTILRKNKFSKEEFLFNAKPYVEGIYHILNKIESICVRKNNKNINIFDLGCGSGLTSYLMARRGFNVSAVDIYNSKQEIQDIFRKRGQRSQKDLWKDLCYSVDNLKIDFFNGTNIPHSNNKFDMVLAHAVIEHIPPNTLLKIFKELNRILKKGGYLVIARTPNKYALTEFIAKSHEIKFSKGEILNLLNNHHYRKIYYQKTDFFPEVGGFKSLQSLLNTISSITHFIDELISKTPLEIFSHHHFIITKKIF